MIGIFGSYVAENLAVGENLIDKIFEQESQRYPDFVTDRSKFAIVNFNIVAPKGTRFTINNSDLCTVVITDSKILSIPSNAFKITDLTFLEDCGSVNCRYLY